MTLIPHLRSAWGAWRPQASQLLLAVALTACALWPDAAYAWWNPEFKQRTRITLNTTVAGIETREALSGLAVPVRLHSGNFDFLGAKPDGSDLRVIAADDKTPLKFSIERFDSANELGVLWVQVPAVVPASDKNVIHVYAGNAQAAAEAPALIADSAAQAVFRFADADGVARDLSATIVSAGPAIVEAAGLIGASARMDGNSSLQWPANERLKAASGAPWTVCLWAKPAGSSGTLLVHGPLAIGLNGGKVEVRLGKLLLAGGDLPVSAWAHVGVTLGAGKVTLYVNGAQAAQADLPTPAPAIDGPVRLGESFVGQIDELQFAAVVRSADWMKFTRAAQGADAKLVASAKQVEGETEGDGGGQHGYMGILVKNLTVDAWVVIGILGVMFVVAAWVMVTKTVVVRRTQQGNDAFISKFRSAPDVLGVEAVQAHPNSSLARLYEAGRGQLVQRGVGTNAAPLSGASLDAVKAAVDADLVRENHKLNSAMVLLTIAISGGPFLGLLGTVVGVMITFAAIAAAGDVNVNAIAPGIAAALLATVAGLAVAIPSLFGYNYLASKIKNQSSDMQIFVDEFVTRVAERYGQR